MEMTKEIMEKLLKATQVPEAIKKSCYDFNVELQQKIKDISEFIENHQLEMHVSGVTVIIAQSHFGAVNPDNLHPDNVEDGGTLDSCIIAGKTDAVTALSNIVIAKKYEQDNEG